MKITYDQEVDAVYIQFIEGEHNTTFGYELPGESLLMAIQLHANDYIDGERSQYDLFPKTEDDEKNTVEQSMR